MTSLIAITTTAKERKAEAQQLANELAIPFFDYENIPSNFKFILLLTADYIGLKQAHQKTLPLYVDFLSAKFNFRTKRANLKNELLARAIGAKPEDHLQILDATAGFGRDSYILASLGFHIIMLEMSPIVWLLLKDGLERASKNQYHAHIVQHLTLINEDAICWLNNQFSHHFRPDIIYLDPMFPERQKSASVKKEMTILQELLPKYNNLQYLFETALTCARKRVVIKRPRLAAPLAKPTYSLTGKTSRFDIYLVT